MHRKFLFLLLWQLAWAGYIPPGPRYRCPKDNLLLHPCSCDIETDKGIYVSCNNTNLASASVALNNLATFDLPIEQLLLNTCHIKRFFGSLLYKLQLRVLKIENTPLESIEEHMFLGVNNTLNELHIVNSSLSQFPSAAFKILGNLTLLNIDGHNLTTLPKDAFSGDIAGKLVRLNIVNGNLTTPPIESTQPLRKLKTLDLHANAMKDLKRNQFKGLRDVEVLDLSHNGIGKIDASHLADLGKLGWLNVSHNSLKELTRGAFARNTVLKLLNMSHNKIKKIDSNSFRGMRFLRRLFLSDNLIADVGRGSFGSLQRIGTIDLARNFIKKIDFQMFSQLKYVEVIDVSENNVTEVQKLAFKDVFLAHINLSRNRIKKVETGAFVNCANITVLDLSHNALSTLPKKAFDEATYAAELQFSYNNFTGMDQIPLQNMTGLKVLNVSHNAIRNIPKKTFPPLYELHTIDLSHNNLSEIFNAVFQPLFSLRTLDLSYNSLETLKATTFGPLPTLLTLDLSYNKLRTVAKSSMSRLASTRTLILKGNKLNKMFILPISTSHLDLSHNAFERWPSKQWPSMNALLTLDLSHNNLGDSLGEDSFNNLLTLQKLNLSYTGITRPPWVALSQLTSLQYLYMQGNNLTKLERNAFGKLPVIFELNLADNHISNISTKAFEGLLQILVLNLTNNNLTHIPNGAFQGLVALQSLDLSHNKIVKIDNKTHGLLDDCLSLEKLNLSHNKISFISKKTFPSNPYFPYKLREIDLSYNTMPVMTFDLTFGTGRVEKLNLSHNAIADIRKGVIGNLTKLKYLDLSFNKLHDITSEKEFFRLPYNVTELYLSNNDLADLPWEHLRNVSRLALLDVRNNNLSTVTSDMTKMVTEGTLVELEGNPLRCDCFLRPLRRYLVGQLSLPSIYKAVTCADPPYLAGNTFLSLPEERLTCAKNVNTTELLEKSKDELGVIPDLRFRELSLRKNSLKLKWRVMKNTDIADSYIFIRDLKNPSSVVYEATLPYFKRGLEVEVPKAVATKSGAGKYQVCVLARDSNNGVRRFYDEQCKDLSESISGVSRNCVNFMSLVVSALFVIYFYV